MPPDSGWPSSAEPYADAPARNPRAVHDADWDTIPAEDRHARMSERLRALLERAWREVPTLRRRFEAAGLTPEATRDIADLDRIPIVDRRWLIAQQFDHPPFGGWLLVPTAQLRAIHLLPGPLRIPEKAEPDYWRWSAALAAAGVEGGSLVFVERTAREPMAPMIETGIAAREALTLSVDPLDASALETVGHWAADAAYIGTARGLEILLARITPGVLRTAVLTAGPISRSLEMRARRLQLEILRATGTPELGCLAFECRPGSDLHVVADRFVQIVNPESGESLPDGELGSIVVSRLDDAYPLLRFATGARAALSSEPCLCGRTTPRLVRFQET
ncbi:MAG: phenylacetate--CoA ligase family protein [Gemmatimonadota bacterium]